jgi:hypothetical protein
MRPILESRLRNPIFEAAVHAPAARPELHEKTIAQSRDRQEAEPLAGARGSVRISIFGTETRPHFLFLCVAPFCERPADGGRELVHAERFP